MQRTTDMKPAQILSALSLCAVLGSGAAGAATLTFSPLNSAVAVGQVFQVTLVGRDFTDGTDGTYGGGVSIAWDPALFQMLSYDTSVFGGDQSLATANTNTVLDNVAGTLSDLSVASLFTGVTTADFDVAVLTFQALAGGTSSLDASIGYFTSGFPNIWTDGDEFIPLELELDFVSGSMTVVPVPAAAWLFLSALGATGVLARRRAA